MPKYLGIGWDVGGWMGMKNAVAVVEWNDTAAKIKWLGEAATFKLPREAERPLSPLSLMGYSIPDVSSELLEQYETVVIAIDAPLGFPLGYKRFINGSNDYLTCPSKEILSPLAYRETERIVANQTGKKPMSAPFDKLGNNTTVAVSYARHWCNEYGFQMLPHSGLKGNGKVIIEVYPALAKEASSPEVFRAIKQLTPNSLKEGSDEYDAAICALHAIALVTEKAPLPRLANPDTSIDKDILSEEGWIYYFEP